MKKIVFSIFVFLFSILSFVPLAFAQTAQSSTTTVLDKNQTINGDYFASGQTVSIHGTVNGDLYVGGGTVLIDGTVNGDVLGAGGNITMSGFAHNVRIVGGQLLVSGTVDGNVSAAGGNVTIADAAKISGSVVGAGGQVAVLASVGKGITLAGGQVVINNSVGGDVLAAAGELTVGSSAKIPGKLTYVSNNNASIDSNAQISGGVAHQFPPKPKNQSAQTKAAAAATFSTLVLFTKLLSFVGLFVLGLILFKFFPRFSESTLNTFIASPWLSLGIGIIAVIVVPVLTIALLITVLGIGLIPVLLAGFFLIVEFGKVYAIVGFGKLFFQQKKKQLDYVIITLLIGIIVYEIVTIIPIIGTLVWMIVGAMGIGVIIISEFNYAKMLQTKKLL